MEDRELSPANMFVVFDVWEKLIFERSSEVRDEKPLNIPDASGWV